MKKTYQKPMVLIEDFTVTETIAAGIYSCGVSMSTESTDSANCDIADIFLNSLWDRGVFGNGLECGEMVDDSYLDGYNGVCYHGAVLAS